MDNTLKPLTFRPYKQLKPIIPILVCISILSPWTLGGVALYGSGTLFSKFCLVLILLGGEFSTAAFLAFYRMKVTLDGDGVMVEDPWTKKFFRLEWSQINFIYHDQQKKNLVFSTKELSRKEVAEIVTSKATFFRANLSVNGTIVFYIGNESFEIFEPFLQNRNVKEIPYF